ncbi:MAG: hypothetical protein U0359_35825 [Byssovorax sp.]
MLDRQRPSRRAWLVRSLALGATTALALAQTSCASLIGVTDTEIDFTVTPGTTNAFFGFTEITLDRDANDANKATLLAVTLDTIKPSTITDLSYMQSLKGELVLGSKRTLVVTGDKFPRGEQAVTLDVQYHDDLRPFFKDGKTIRIEWAGTTTPGYPWPADGLGITIRGRVKIDVE